MATAIEMAKTEAMKNLIGRLARATRLTHSGSEEIIGSIIAPLMVEEDLDGKETITHATLEGMIVATHITGLPLPIEIEKPVKLELHPIGEIELL